MAALPHKWIGRAGPVAWKNPSSLLTPLDCLWGHFKTVVYSSKLRHLIERQVRITNSFHGISKQQLDSVFNQLTCRLEGFVQCDGSYV
jgi:hypothetical protein